MNPPVLKLPFAPLEFILQVGRMNIDKSAAMVVSDYETFQTTSYSLLEHVTSSFVQMFNQAPQWNAEPWLSVYPEYQDIYDAIAKGFDPNNFETEIAEIANSIGSCGLVYEVFADNFSNAIDSKIGRFFNRPDLKSQYLTIAEDHGYSTKEARNEYWNNLGDEYCSTSGIEINCCPCGRHP